MRTKEENSIGLPEPTGMYIVMASQGRYEDFHTWPTSAFFHESQAKAFIEHLENRQSLLPSGRENEERRTEIMETWVDGWYEDDFKYPSYSIKSVPLRIWPTDGLPK